VAASLGQTTSAVAEHDTEEYGHEPIRRKKTRKNPKNPHPISCTGNPVELLERDLISRTLTMVLAQAPVEAQAFCVQPPFPRGCG